MLSLLKPLLMPIAKYTLIGMVSYFAYSQILTALHNYNTNLVNQGKRLTALKINKETIISLQNNISLINEQLKQNQRTLEKQILITRKANESKNKIIKILSRHDTTKLLKSKPGLMDNIYNRGIIQYNRMWVSQTRSIGNSNNSNKNNLSTISKINTTKSSNVVTSKSKNNNK